MDANGEITYSLREWAKTARGSAVGLGSNQRDHILSGNGTRPQEGQQSVLDPNSEITYKLRAGKAARGSVIGLAFKYQDHVLAEGRTRP